MRGYFAGLPERHQPRGGEFQEIHQRLGQMHGYGFYHAANGLSVECRVNRHEDCVEEACVCACHAGEDDDL